MRPPLPPSPSRRSSGPSGDASRLAILDAARDLFSTQGLHATSMNDIAARAHVSRATVFNQFGSKQLILDAIMAGSLTVYRNLLAEGLADETTPTIDLLKRLFSNMGHGVERNQPMHKELFGEIRRVPMSLDAPGLSPVIRKEAFDLLTEIISRGQKRGELSTRFPPETVALALDSLLSGAILHWLHRAGDAALASLLVEMSEVLLEGAATRPHPR